MIPHPPPSHFKHLSLLPPSSSTTPPRPLKILIIHKLSKILDRQHIIIMGWSFSNETAIPIKKFISSAVGKIYQLRTKSLGTRKCFHQKLAWFEFQQTAFWKKVRCFLLILIGCGILGEST